MIALQERRWSLPTAVTARIRAECDLAMLQRWLLLSLRAAAAEAFVRGMDGTDVSPGG